jgi:hypothetical protein
MPRRVGSRCWRFASARANSSKAVFWFTCFPPWNPAGRHSATPRGDEVTSWVPSARGELRAHRRSRYGRRAWHRDRKGRLALKRRLLKLEPLGRFDFAGVGHGNGSTFDDAREIWGAGRPSGSLFASRSRNSAWPLCALNSLDSVEPRWSLFSSRPMRTGRAAAGTGRTNRSSGAGLRVPSRRTKPRTAEMCAGFLGLYF